MGKKILNLIQDVSHIAKKDLIEFSRDHLRLATFFIMPVFMMVGIGFIYPSQNTLQHITIGVVNLDDKLGKTLVETIENLKQSKEADTVFSVVKFGTIDELKEGIKKQEVAGGFYIPSNFTEKINSNEIPEVGIIQDQSNPQIAQSITSVLKTIIEGFGSQIGMEKASQLISSLDGNMEFIISPASIINPIIVKSEGITGSEGNYFQFVAPGIIAMIVMTSVLSGLAGSVAHEKEQGTLDGILISPISRLAIIIGKALSQSVRGLLQGGIVLLLAVVLFNVNVTGNLILITTLLLLGIFSFVGMGILVSALATEQETAALLLSMFQFPMMFLSGVFFPVLMMPEFMQKLSRLIPLTYSINALRKVIVLDAGFPEVQHEILILFIFGAITLSISVPVFKRVITK